MTVFLETTWQILRGIGAGAPIWVWPLFFVLFVIGWRASKTREGPLVPYYFIPLLGIMTLNNVAGLAHPHWAWVTFGAGYIAFGIAAFRYQNARILSRCAKRITLQGEWLTMLTVMTIFFANFVRGILANVAPNLLQAPSFVAVFAGLLGACAGCFLGRSLRIVTYKSTL